MNKNKLKNHIKTLLREEEEWNLVKYQAAARNRMSPEEKADQDKATIQKMKKQYLQTGKYATFFYDIIYYLP